MKRSSLLLLLLALSLIWARGAAAAPDGHHGHDKAADKAPAKEQKKAEAPPEDAEKLLESIRGSIKTHPLRQEYEREVARLAEQAKALEQQGRPLAEVARTMHKARRDLGVKYKNVTPELLREYIYEVNQERYGDPLGPSFEYLEKKNSKGGVISYRTIIEGACRPNPDVDKLLAGFEDWLRKKGKIK